MSIERGSLLYQTGRYAEAEDQFRQALGAEPGNALGHAMLAMCLLHGKKYDDADGEARQAIGLRPDWYVGYSVLANIYSERERLKEAVRAIGKAIEMNPFVAGLHASLSGIRLKQGDWKGALAAADAGMAVDPADPGCVNCRGTALIQLGRTAEAGRTLDGALERNPLDPDAHTAQGWAMLHAGEPRAALVHFREALRLDPSLDGARAGMVEALKARNVIYRALLWYFLFMARRSSAVQWGIIIGMYVGQQALFALSDKHPGARPYVQPIIIAYLIFALLTWLARPLFNLVLMFDKFGRYALSPDQKRGSLVVGGLLAAGAVVFGAGHLRSDGVLETAGMMTAFLSMPASAIFWCPVGWPRWVMVVYTAVMACVMGFYVLVPNVRSLPAGPNWAAMWQGSLTVFEYGVLLSGFVAGGLSAARVRK